MIRLVAALTLLVALSSGRINSWQQEKADFVSSLPRFQPPGGAAIKHELKDILSAREYNRVYRTSEMPKWWRKFWEAVSNGIARFFEWLARALSFAGESTGRITSFVFACLAILAFLILLGMIVKRLMGSMVGAAEDGRRAGLDRYDLPTAGPLIREAAKLAESGDYRGAFRCAYLASISYLDEIKALRFERSRTNWEYLRELERGGFEEPRRELLPLTSDFDRKFYGRETCDRRDYQNALDAYARISSGGAA